MSGSVEQECCKVCTFYDLESKKCENREEYPIDPDDWCEMFFNKKNKENLCSTCHKKPGKPRVDRDISAGIHCDECWNDMIYKCRQRSW